MQISINALTHRTRTAASIAATLLIASGCTFTQTAGHQTRALTQNEQRLVDETRQKALETMSSGNGLSWRSSNGLVNGSVTPLRTWRHTNTGYWCREFEELVIIDGTVQTIRNGACRGDDGVWREVTF